MSYGILIDAFMITNKQGEVQKLDTFLNKETNEFIVDPDQFNKYLISLLSTRSNYFILELR